ncbi:RHS repeat-associated core domain-containing protein [Pseudomonas sp. zfem002]|uniref:RHS repeat-associated core domain-containing protein n=1 Tax=Pseudomonas sp. zfem002 TaxID=3078197 RepID=UPI0029276530|nr:RHS repeat-associated core domain-containing protein [Pseudomonas sp. zfem002]MDU9389399.1 RHS repeat-associated core domain-containing protein [Pseudomonas sp. zfem002]
MQIDGSTSARALLLAVDRHNTPVLEVNGRSTVVQRFSVYGWRAAGQEVAGTLGFNGEYRERSGVYLLGSYRTYSPLSRRFHQPDSLSPFGVGGSNAYAYCRGDPVNHIDPDGHSPLAYIALGFGVLSAASMVGAVLREGRAREALITIAAVTGAIAGGVALYWRLAGGTPRVQAPAQGQQGSPRGVDLARRESWPPAYSRTPPPGHAVSPPAYSPPSRRESLDNFGRSPVGSIRSVTGHRGPGSTGVPGNSGVNDIRRRSI